MGVKEIAKELKEEIKRTEDKLAQLRAMDNIVTGMEISNNLKNLPKESFPDAVPLEKPQKFKRRIKYMQFSPTEERQIINLWNSMKDIPNITNQTIIAKIANIMKYPYKKMYNKIFWLRRTGKIVAPQGMFMGTMHNGMSGRKKPFVLWTEAQEQQLINLSVMGKTPSEIAMIMGIKKKRVVNKIDRMKASGLIPKEQPIPRNPLLNI